MNTKTPTFFGEKTAEKNEVKDQKIRKFLILKFPEFFKTYPTFVFSPLLVFVAKIFAVNFL